MIFLKIYGLHGHIGREWTLWTFLGEGTIRISESRFQGEPRR